MTLIFVSALFSVEYLGQETAGFLMYSVREALASEWRTEAARAAQGTSSDNIRDLKSPFERRVRLTVLRATGLAKV